MVDPAAAVPGCAWPVDAGACTPEGDSGSATDPSRRVRPCAAGRVQTGTGGVESTIWRAIQSAPQLLDLGGGQAAVAARRQAAQPQRPERHALQRLHTMPDGLAHPPHLALAALVDGDLEHAGGDAADLGRRGPAVVELDALAQLAQRR